MPGWAVNVATTIHSDEALLAVSFIFVVHFFNTHFRPEKFPIDTVIFTEGMPLEDSSATGRGNTANWWRAANWRNTTDAGARAAAT